MDGGYSSENNGETRGDTSDQNAQLAFLLEQLSKTTGMPVSTTIAPVTNTRQNPQVQPVQSRPSIERSVDVRSITTYSQALQFIVEVLSRESMFKDNVRALIEDQEHQEKKWYQERQDIIQRQTVRDSGREKLASVLKIVCGYTESAGNADGAKNTDEEAKAKEHQQELEAFDSRVYTMLTRLAKDTANRLAELRVPLFCIRPELLNSRVLEDRKKVLSFLQDFCCEE